MFLAAPATAWNTATIYSGTAANKINLIFLSDGYTSAQISNFATDAQTAYNTFFSQELGDYKDFFNVYRVDVISNQSGASNENCSGNVVDNALGSAFSIVAGNSSSCRSLSSNINLAHAAAGSVAGFVQGRDIVLVIVNSVAYGGAAWYGGIGSCSITSGPDCLTHEAGHCFGLLSDEYVESTGYYSGGEPSQRNVTINTDRSTLKWGEWVFPATPLPTIGPAGSAEVGLFEGAAYKPLGVYRPTYISKMNESADLFGPVNTEIFVNRIFDYLPDTTPPAADIKINGSCGAACPAGPATLSLSAADTDSNPLAYRVSNNASFTDTAWQLTSSGSSFSKTVGDWTLGYGDTVYLQVKNGRGLTGSAYCSCQSGATPDTTPPTQPVVSDSLGSDRDYGDSLTRLSANWTASTDQESGIVKYRYAIGTTPGGTDITNWTSVGLSLNAIKTDLSLAYGQMYYFSVKAENGAGINSTPANSNGQSVDTTAPATVATVNDGLGADIATTDSRTELSANWTVSSDAESGILRYWYAIGTVAGGTNIVDWTDNGTALSVTKTGLLVPNGSTVYFSVKAENGAGTYSTPANSNGQTVNAAAQSSTVTDIDGNVYHTVIIGTNTWTVENLRTTRFRNGDSISNITDDTAWANAGSAAYCSYDNDSGNVPTYGLLYNWYAAADNRNIAPSGWHVPSRQEWNRASDWLIANGYNYDATTSGNKIAKSIAGNSSWAASATAGAPGNNQAANNSSGFTAYASGLRYGISGVFGAMSASSLFWTSTLNTDVESYYQGLFYGYTFLGDYVTGNKYGMAVRLIRDDTPPDSTPPGAVPAVSDGAGADITYTGSLTQLAANWSAATDAESGIAKYWYAIGTSAGAANIAGWTDNGAALSVTRTGLSLTTGQTYYFTVKAENGVGLQSAAANSNGQTVDASAPAAVAAVNDGTGADSAYTGSLTQLAANWGTSSDAQSGIVKYWYAIGSTAGGADIRGWTDNGSARSVTAAGLSLSDGQTYYFSVKAENGAGLLSAAANSNGQLVDATAPAAPSTSRDGTGADINYTGSLTQLSANWNAGSDAQSGIVKYWYAIGTAAGGTNVAGWTDNGGSLSVTRTGLSLSNGTTYYFTVKAENGAGLLSAAANSDGQLVDTSAPAAVATVNDGAGADIVYTGSLTQLKANWSASSDAQSGVAKYWYAIGTAAGGTDVAGWTDNGGSLSVTKTGLSLTTGQTYYFSVKAENRAGLLSAAANSNGQTADGSAPAAIAAVNDGTGADISYTTSATQISANWSASSDAQSGIARYWYAIGFTQDDPTSLLGWTDNGSSRAVTYFTNSMTEGDHVYFFVKAENGAGLLSAETMSDGQTLDSTPPSAVAVVNDGTGADITYSSSTSRFSANWSAAADNYSGIAKYWYAAGTAPGATDIAPWTDNGAARAVTVSGPGLDDGATCYFSIKAQNGAGLYSTPVNSNGQTVDASTPPEPPTTSATHQPNVWNTVSNNPQFSWLVLDDGPSGVAGYSVALVQSAAYSPAMTVNLTANTTTFQNVPDGTWYFYVKAKDNAGNWGDPARYGPVKIDLLAPVLQGIAVSRDPAKEGPITLTVTLNKEMSAMSATVTQNGASAAAVPLTSQNNITWSGTYTVLAGYDGNAAISVSGLDLHARPLAGSASFAVDTTAPGTPAITSPTHAENASTSLNTPSFTWSAAAETGSGLAGYSYALNQAEAYTLDAVTETVLTNYTGPLTADGTYWFHLRGVDDAGNAGAIARYKFTVDTASPTLTVTAAPDPAKAGPVTITLLSSEDLKEPPAISVTQHGQGAATPVVLSAAGALSWQGVYTAVPGFEGTAAIASSGKDLASNTGVKNASFQVDTVGPRAVIVVTPVQPLKTGVFSVAVTLQDAGSIPQAPLLSYTPSGGLTVPLTLTGANKNWTGHGFINPGVPNGTAAFDLSATDTAGNVGTLILTGATFAIDTSLSGLSGGVFYSDDGTMVTVPANAYAGQLDVEIARPDPSGGQLGTAFQNTGGLVPVQAVNLYRMFTATDTNTQAVIPGFDLPVTITIPYPDADNDGLVDGTHIKETKLSLYWLNEAFSRWELVAGSVPDYVQNHFSAAVPHFSTYGLLVSAAPGLDSVKVYPVPWTPGSGGRYDSPAAGCGAGVNFENLGLEGRITIYNLQGDRIRKLAIAASDGGCKAWDGKNEAGRAAASGVYMAVIENAAGKRAVKKLVIER